MYCDVYVGSCVFSVSAVVAVSILHFCFLGWSVGVYGCSAERQEVFAGRNFVGISPESFYLNLS